MRVPIRLLVVVMLGLFAASVVAILWRHRATTESEIVSGMRAILTNVSDVTLTRSESFLADAQGDAQLAVLLMESGTLSWETELEDYFGRVLQDSPSASGMFYGSESGDFLFVDRTDELGPAGYRTKKISVSGGQRAVDLTFRNAEFDVQEMRVDPEDTFDPRTRPWYAEAVAAGGQPIVTDPYVFFTRQEPGVTAAVSVLDPDGNVQGVVGVDISLIQLSEFLGELRLGDNGLAFIVTKSGGVIALEDISQLQQPDGNGYRLSNVFEVEPPVVAKTFEMEIADGLAGDASFLTVDRDSGTGHVFVAPLGTSDWVLGVALSENDFLGEIRQIDRDNTIVAATIAVLSLIVAGLLIRNVTGPLSELRKRAAEIETGKLELKPVMRTRITELHRTSYAFDHMVAGLKDQRRQNDRTTKALEQFAYMASHDLKAPLKKMVNLADLAVMDPDGGAELLEPIRDSAVHLEELVHGYGRLAGLEHGQVEQRTVSALVAEAHEASTSDLEIDLRDDAKLTCDPVLMTQLMVNLLDNASKYGSGDDVVIDTRNEEESVVITVSNAVEGALNVDNSVFAPFRRLVVDDRGSGLGLAIVERIAHLHGGSVSARCVDETFTVEVELAK